MSASRPLIVRLLPVLDFGGAESRLTLQCEMARDRRYELRVCTFHRAGRAAKRIEALGVPVDVLDIAPSVRSPRATAALVSYLRRVRPEILHSSIAEANVHGLVAGALARIPVRIAEEVGAPSHSTIGRLGFRVLYRLATRVVGVTKAVAEYIVSVDGAPPERVRHIYNCAGPSFFPEERRPIRATHAKPFRLLAVGRFETVKNHEVLLRGMALLVQERPQVQLDLAGDGPLADKLRDLAQELGLSEHVRFLGFRGDVIDLLSGADGYVLPSLSEGCSISLVEAMATGLPVVGSDVAGIREVMGDELAPRWTFAPTDPRSVAECLGRLVDASAAERARLGGASQRRAYDGFSPRAYMDNLDDLYGDALASVGRR